METTDLYKNLITFVSDDKAEFIFNTVKDTLTDQYGKDGLTMRNLCFIRPKELSKLVGKNKETYYDIVQAISMYKIVNNLDIGFNVNKYEEDYNRYLEKFVDKRYRDSVRKPPKIIRQTLDDYKSITYDEYLEYIKKRFNAEMTEPNQFMTDYSDTKFGKLQPLQPFHKEGYSCQAIFWTCKCDCGAFISERGDRLKYHKDCGSCLPENEEDIIGERNGNLTIQEQKWYIKKTGKWDRVVLVKCDCGNTVTMSYDKFKTTTYCCKGCALCKEMFSKTATKNKEFKKLFHNGTNVYKLDRDIDEVNRNNKTGYLGVTYLKVNGKYLAYIVFKGKRYNLGLYETAKYASRVREQAQIMLYGKYAKGVKDDEFIKNNKYLVRLTEKLENRMEEESI